jgi:hypothetical protein
MAPLNALRNFRHVLPLLIAATAIALLFPTLASARNKAFSGDVVSASGNPVVGATVYIVPVSAIDTNSPITASSIYAPPFPAEAYDEPLEDAIRLRGRGFAKTTTDTRGKFSIAKFDDEAAFIHVTVAQEDTEHLPGGDKSRRAYSATELRSEPMTITLSSSPPEDAYTMGSSTCLACHPQHRGFTQTAHKLGWTVPGAPGPLQDHSRHSGFFDALESFVLTDNFLSGTHLELGDYDARRKSDKFRLRAFADTRLPINKIYADVYLWQSTLGQKYFITMVNSLNPEDPNSPAHLEIKLLYGGAVHDQRYIVAVPPKLAHRPGWYTLLRYNMSGRDNRLDPTRRVWQDYKFYLWWSAGTDGQYGSDDDLIKAPPININTVQAMCAGCHLNGWQRYQDPASGQFLVRAVNDPGGAMNIDDDPQMDEINIGCENCHGPGSAHVANGGRSRFIVNPKYLSAERSSVVCGRCHDRRQGYGGPIMGYTQAISQQGELMRPGGSRHALITKYTDPVKKGPTMKGPSARINGEDKTAHDDNIWPDDVHSSKPHQQYADFIKSKMYRNDRLLVTCTDCHDLHGGTAYPRWLIHDPNDANSPLCQRCHEVDLLNHMETKLNAKMKGHLTRCIDCHMPGTANTGGIAGHFGRMIKTPPYANAEDEQNNAYWESPINSHVFDVPLKTNVAVDGVAPGKAMPIAYTSACGTCHVVDELPFK